MHRVLFSIVGTVGYTLLFSSDCILSCNCIMTLGINLSELQEWLNEATVGCLHPHITLQGTVTPVVIQGQCWVPVFRNRAYLLLVELFPPGTARSPCFPDSLLSFSDFLPIFPSVVSLALYLQGPAFHFSLFSFPRMINSTISEDDNTLVACNLHNSTCYFGGQLPYAMYFTNILFLKNLSSLVRNPWCGHELSKFSNEETNAW